LVVDAHVFSGRQIKNYLAIFQELSRKKWLEICVGNGSGVAQCAEAREGKVEHQERAV
jgi:tRNA G46 methylase TrmB